ncbi:PREDICTED: syntaxin-18 isoform X1 [Rhagoletis zephyria]|uniref:syntaxin-18 isoform X1 n=1 Tax=Rhagoletis zephyria TaxID=28612 RepID=UPI000811376A|nr:PREDICTED: syntaxin-18 isoform X1 [Rhagoletis zephyria]XP_017466106.1 PREDICTED: syntaxin-18 isoform X1 [Rhagoletis zephyria]
MDITQKFKAGVMTVKLQRKGELPPQPLDKQRILSKSGVGLSVGQRDEFSRQAKDVCHKITTLRNVLVENRAAYMRIGQHLKSATHMTDEQRDLIDRESEKFVTFYTQHLAQMRADWKRAKRKPQQQQHMEAVLDLLERYLRSVQQIYLDQKRYRVQYELETYKLLKLAADKKKIPVRPAGEHSGRRVIRHSPSSTTDDEDIPDDLRPQKSLSDEALDLQGDWLDDDDFGDNDRGNKKVINNAADGKLNGYSYVDKSTKVSGPQLRHRNPHAEDEENIGSGGELKTTQSSQKVALDEDIQKSQQLEDEAKKLSPEDVQMYEQENVQLYHELQGLVEEVEQIEKNVVDIAQLQDIFTEKVSLQQHNIERIASAVVGATENVKDANEQIQQAIQRNAGLRVWSLFFLLVMSFALLFLDWYYD